MHLPARAAHATTQNALSRALSARRRAGHPVIDLTVSNPTTAKLPYEREAILTALASTDALTYAPEPLGLPAARATIAQYTRMPTDRVVLTASTSEAYALLFKALCDPGDEVLVPAPSYPLFDQLAGIEGVRLVPYRLAYDGAWHVDVPTLCAARTQRTRAVLAVSPNNPTGNVLTRDELRALASLGLPVISDEVFAEYTFRRGADAVSSAALEAGDALVVTLGGLSKLCALPQLKLAWMAVGGPEPLARELLARLEWIADAFLSVGSPVQHALPALLVAGRTTRAAIQERVVCNQGVARRALAGSSATVLDVEAGWYAIVQLPATRSEEEWVMDLLERGVYAHPGHFFDMATEPFLVVSLLTPERDFQAGIESMRAMLEGSELTATARAGDASP